MEVKANTTNLVAIGAHQDDIEIIGIDGILKAYGSKKYAFYACVVGDGSNCVRCGKYADFSQKEIVEVRNQEQLRASQIGEYSGLAILKHTNEDIKGDDKDKIVKEIKDILMEVKPDVVYTHSIFDKSPTHRITCMKTIKAILEMPEEDRPRLVYGSEIFRSLDWLPDKYKVTFDLSENKELQARLVGVYDTRMEQYKNYTKAVSGRKLSNAVFGAPLSMVDEDKMAWYAINLTPVIQKNIPLKEFCVKVLNDYNKEMLDNIN